MNIPKNTFKAAIMSGRQQIGLWSSLASAISTEVIAGSGFDWILLDMEHSPNDLADIYFQLQAIMESPTQAVVRVPSDDPVTIKRILDAGAQSLMIPMIEDAEQAARAVAATRYPPHGVRGFSQAPRAARFGRIANYHTLAQAEICVILQIESQKGLDNLEAIAGVAGVDSVFVGPGDLSTSLGYIGQQGHADVVDVIEKTIKRVADCGSRVGILTGDETLARRYIAAGTAYTAVGSDMSLLARTTEALAARFKTA